MTARIALAFGALLAAAFPVFAQSSKHVNAIACKDSVCRLAVKVDGDCTITVDPDWLFVSGSNVQLVFEILPSGYYFRPGDGIQFKDDYNPAWRGEFFQGRGEGQFLTDQVAVQGGGPARQSVWTDLNSQRGVFRYAVNIVNSRTGTQCTADPGVVNDW
jgi:hypothetical protein